MSIALIIILTLLASGLFSGSEIAFVSANKLQVEVDKGKGKWSARLLSYFFERSSLFIAMLLLGNNIALVIYGLAMEKTLIPPLSQELPQWLNNELIILFIETVISTLIILIFAEFIPKALFRINANSILNWLILFLTPLYYLFLPVVYLFIKVSEIILRFFFRTSIVEPEYAFSSTDLQHYISEFTPAKDNEDGEDSAWEMVQNAINFKTVKVRECMVPRTRINAIDIDEPIDALVKLFVETGHSKIPVYRESIDHIIGYVHAYNIFKNPLKINQILRNIHFVPETMPANTLLEKMIKEKLSIAVVLDEFGGTAGIITLEDLMEEIFGEIEDEFDKQEWVQRQIDENTFILSGAIEIDHINKEFDLNIEESEEYNTLGGYIIKHSENIPKVNEQIDINGFSFIILKASDVKIELVKMIRHTE